MVKCPRFQRYIELRALPSSFSITESLPVHTFQRILDIQEAEVPNGKEGKQKSVTSKMFFCLDLLSRSPTKRLFWSKHFGGHVVHIAASLTWFFIFKIRENQRKFGFFFFQWGRAWIICVAQENVSWGPNQACSRFSVSHHPLKAVLNLTRGQLCTSSL